MNFKRFSRFSRGLRRNVAGFDPESFKTPASAGAFVPTYGPKIFRRGVFVLLAAVGLTSHPAVSAHPVADVRQAVTAQAPPVSGGDTVRQAAAPSAAQSPVQIVERTTVYEQSTAGMDRTERRAYRAKVYAAKIDSLVQSRDYMFFPNTMQEIPGGLIRNIYAEYFYFGMFIDHVEVHLPTERGISQYVEILNFDSMSVRNYQAARVQWGWSVTFNVIDGDDTYHADLAVSTATGETILTVITPRLTMRYVGWLWDKKIKDPKFHDMNW